MNGSSISHDWAKIRDKKQEEKKKQIELNSRTGIFFALHTALQWNFLFPPFYSIDEEKKKRESSRSGSLNDLHLPPFLSYCRSQKIL